MDNVQLPVAYNAAIEGVREVEYPMLKDVIYIDHAGSTPPAKSLLNRFATDLGSTLYSNPHSASTSSQLTSSRIANIRLRLLSLFNADPTEFDLVFTSNATAAVKLVVEAFRAVPAGFRYVYHEACHTSLVGVRQEAVGSICIDSGTVEDWVEGLAPLLEGGRQAASDDIIPTLFAYSAQSHMDGRRYPFSWGSSIRTGAGTRRGRLFTLVDVASFATTSPLDLSDAASAPDFAVLSLHKMFGFPDLGALIVRKEAAHVFDSRRYFGGGTVDVVVCGKREEWHISKQGALYERLEDGTLPFHGIIALDAAMDIHSELFGTMQKVAAHTAFLAHRLYRGLQELRHVNGQPVCVIYSPPRNDGQNSAESDSGPIVAFNIKSQGGAWISIAEFEKLAALRSLHIRTGSLCCPGGSSAALGLEPWEVRRNFSTGVKCGTDADSDIAAGKPTGMIRASMGPMSTINDVDQLVAFVAEFYTETTPVSSVPPRSVPTKSPASRLRVKSLRVYPIKSCGGYRVPPDSPWEIRPEGLAWDREWCVMHPGTGKALSQKQYPRMALLKPTLDFEAGLLRVAYADPAGCTARREISVPLSANPNLLEVRAFDSQVCGDAVVAQRYVSKEVNDFFQAVIGVPCTLARFPSGGSGRKMRVSTARVQKHQMEEHAEMMPPVPPSPPDSDQMQLPRILLSNESAMLTIYSPSVDAFNKALVARGGSPISDTAFRANVVLEPISGSSSGITPLLNILQGQQGASSTYKAPPPYSEDFWQTLAIGTQQFELLGACRRCHMVCVDQDTAERNGDVFVTLAKTRRFEDGKAYFGIHMRHADEDNTGTAEAQFPTVSVGDEACIT